MCPLTLSFSNDEIDHSQKKRRDSAADFLNNCYGWRQIDELINNYWKKVINYSIIPAVEEIVFELRNRNIIENNKFYFYDTEQNIFYVPHKTSDILVHSTCHKDYLYILNNSGFHIRQIWRLWNPESFDWTNTYVNESLCDIYQVIERLPIMDNGYILSVMFYDQKIMGTQYSFKDLELISSNYIPDIINELELDI